MEKKNIKEIDTDLINRENYQDKFKKAEEYLENLRKDLDFHISLDLFHFISSPDLKNLKDLSASLNLKKLLNNEIAEAVATAYRTGELEWDEEHYNLIKETAEKLEEADKEADEFLNNHTAEEIWAKALNLLTEDK